MTAQEADALPSHALVPVVEGTFAYCPNLYVQADCVGGQFRTAIAGHKVTILLPRIGEDLLLGITPILTAPDTQYEYAVQADGRFWGIVSTRDGQYCRTAQISRLAYRFEVAGSESDVESVCREIEFSLKDWWLSLEAWLDIYTDLDLLGHQRGTGGPPTRGHALTAHVGDQPGDTAQRLTWKQRSQAAMPRPRAVNIPDSAVLARCLHLAGSGSLPPQGWLYLREARSWLKAGQTRRAVIDACTGAEISLSYQVRQHAKADPVVVDQLLEQCKGIADVVKVLTRIGGVTASRNSITTKLADVRNKAVHAGWEPDVETAEQALAVATAVVDHAWPHAALCPDTSAATV
ncbi:hypothetical protein ACFTS5_07860 [Nocardia sp. NPDC056952]|uniref:hypothetical protein n=1 Tax=Nocardia sp. NPDC056952 TaxID=3345979 RepID=UPI00362B7059